MIIKEKIVNLANNTEEVIERPMTSEELEQYETDLAVAEIEQAQTLAKETTRAALLDKLGITADEAALLGL
jgi:sulfur carrier protein ThiS